jgi:uncharacterized membrane protein
MVDLGAIGGGESHAVAISDNDTVVGYNARTGGAWQAFAWTAAGGMENIEPPDSHYSVAQAISPNGIYVAGVAGTDAAMWTRTRNRRHHEPPSDDLARGRTLFNR